MKELGTKIQYMAGKIIESMTQSGQVTAKDIKDFERVMSDIAMQISNGVTVENLSMPNGCSDQVKELAIVITESLDEEEPLMREFVKLNPQKAKTQKVGGHWDGYDDYYDNYWYNDFWYGGYYPNYYYYPYYYQSWYYPYWLNNWSNYYWWPYYGYGGYNFLGY